MMAASHDVDLFVIGAGSGGVRASRIAAGYGARVGVEGLASGSAARAGLARRRNAATETSLIMGISFKLYQLPEKHAPVPLPARLSADIVGPATEIWPC